VPCRRMQAACAGARDRLHPAHVPAHAAPVCSHRPRRAQVGDFTEFRCKAGAPQPAAPGGSGAPAAADARCWARTGHTLTMARTP